MAEDTSRYCHNHELFSPSYFAGILRDQTILPRLWQSPQGVESLLGQVLSRWADSCRGTFLLSDPKRAADALGWVGLPPGTRPPLRESESDIENAFIRPLVEHVFGLAVTQNLRFNLQGSAAEEAVREGRGMKRPDMIIFPDVQTRDTTLRPSPTPPTRPCSTTCGNYR